MTNDPRDTTASPDPEELESLVEKLQAENQSLRAIVGEREQGWELRLAEARDTAKWKAELWELREARFARLTRGWAPPLSLALGLAIVGPLSLILGVVIGGSISL